jgi:hypothetical protein
LSFTSVGFESVSVFDPVDKSKLIAEENAEVFRIEGSLIEWDTLNPGQYVFPFTLQIPSYAPSTFYFAGADQRGFYITARIWYQITSTLSAFPQFTLTHTRTILIKNRNCLNSPAISITQSEGLSGCCYNRGETQFVLSIQNQEHCEVNGDVYYKLTPDNSRCRSPINHVIGTVVMECTVSTRKGEFKVIIPISKIDRATWISGLSGMIFEKDFEYHSQLFPGENLNPSSNTTPLIKCTYFVEMLAFYDLYWRKEPASIILPFHVNPRNLIPKEVPKLPETWNPSEAGIASFADTKGESMQRSSLKMTSPDIFGSS